MTTTQEKPREFMSVKIWYLHKSGVLFDFDVMSDSPTKKFTSFEDFDQLQKENERLQSDKKTLVEALKFYAIGWVQKNSRIDEWGVPRQVWKNVPVQDDAGKRARQVLMELE